MDYFALLKKYCKDFENAKSNELADKYLALIIDLLNKSPEDIDKVDSNEE